MALLKPGARVVAGKDTYGGSHYLLQHTLPQWGVQVTLCDTTDAAAFEAWTGSESFRAAHAHAGQQRDLYLGPPQFEGFDVVL